MFQTLKGNQKRVLPAQKATHI